MPDRLLTWQFYMFFLALSCFTHFTANDQFCYFEIWFQHVFGMHVWNPMDNSHIAWHETILVPNTRFKGRFKPIFSAYSIIPGNMTSNPIRVCCLSSEVDTKLDPIKWRPVHKKEENWIKILQIETSSMKKDHDMITLFNMFFSNAPSFQQVHKLM